jgi:hypothetical protein
MKHKKRMRINTLNGAHSLTYTLLPRPEVG